jgi:pimeloyl-ACP methyl ester carboxylesterase
MFFMVRPTLIRPASGRPSIRSRAVAHPCFPTMSLHLMTRLVALAAIVFLGACTPLAKVTEFKPSRAGHVANDGDPKAALAFEVQKAEDAWRTLDRNPADAGARADYNFAVGRICSTLRESRLAPWQAPIALGKHTLSWERHRLPVWNPALYELIPTDGLKISGSTFDVRETKAGIGAPVVAKRAADPARDYAPTPHFYYAATVVARFEGNRCVLRIEDPLESETVRVGSHSFPLAAGYTSPLAMMLVEMHPEKLGLPRLLHPAKFASTTRIARLEPYDPNKTVVLVVHGLMSSPATWFPMINHLRADPMVRRKYQFWFYSYPTGYPYAYSAAILRQELDAAEKRYPMRKKMVVIGHSMGGCISRLLITNAQHRIWDQMFTVPPGRMNVSGEHRHILEESSIFANRPEIGRVIFISAPLRGATLASGWLGRFGATLVQMPGDMIKLGKERAHYARAGEGHRHLDRFPDSVDTLSPDNDFVRALNTVPLVNGVPYHTIAGDRGRGDAPKSSDGLVPYWSSHLPEAVSEKIVPSHHNAQQNPEAYAEVLRILKLNSK